MGDEEKMNVTLSASPRPRSLGGKQMTVSIHSYDAPSKQAVVWGCNARNGVRVLNFVQRANRTTFTQVHETNSTVGDLMKVRQRRMMQHQLQAADPHGGGGDP